MGEVSEQATFNTSLMGELVSSEFKKFYYLSTRSSTLLWAHSAKPQLREDLMAELVQQLQLLLGQYIADDHIGNGIAYLLRGTVEPSISEFALDVIRAAVILGPEQTAMMLHQWANQEPVDYHLCAILTGISGDCFLKLKEDGIRFETLPNNDWDQLPAHLPFDSIRSIGDSDLAGQVKVIIDCKAEPALYNPREGKPQYQRTWAHGPVRSSLLDLLSEALSLTLDKYVAWRIWWHDLGNLEVFKHSGGTLTSYSPRYEFVPPAPVEMFRQRAPEIRKLLFTRLDRKTKEGSVDRAIKRWMRSKRSGDVVDQFIELRVALESLYLSGGGGGSRFHVSNYGAWHLGKDLSERREIQKTLRDTYDVASKAVHGSSIAKVEERRNLLICAQALCRRGILKRLDEEQEPNWDELILGASI